MWKSVLEIGFEPRISTVGTRGKFARVRHDQYASRTISVHAIAFRHHDCARHIPTDYGITIGRHTRSDCVSGRHPGDRGHNRQPSRDPEQGDGRRKPASGWRRKNAFSSRKKLNISDTKSTRKAWSPRTRNSARSRRHTDLIMEPNWSHTLEFWTTMENSSRNSRQP